MPIVELIVAVCLSAQPDVCSEKNFQFYEGSTMWGCMLQAQPWLADWSAHNPEWTVKAWKCGVPGPHGRDA